MAKATKAAVKEKAPATPVGIPELATEFGVEDPSKLRQFIRSLGIKAPKVEGAIGFGPRSKYQWDPEDPQLAEIRAKWAELGGKPVAGPKTEKAAKPKKEKAEKPAKKSSKRSEPEPEEDEDDDEDVDEDDD